MAELVCNDGCVPFVDTSKDGLLAGSEAITLVVAGVLVVMSAIFSGLTLGLLSLDKTGLQILAEAGTPIERARAKHIMPLRANGNLLLCTLLIGNVVVNSYLSILLAGFSSGVVGLLVSTGLIVILGEIVPQAVCSRHGILVGTYTRHLTWTFLFCFYPFAKPISMVLDWALGAEIGTLYSKDELKRLLQLHVEDPNNESKETGITRDDHNLLAGAGNALPSGVPVVSVCGATQGRSYSGTDQ